MRKNIARTLLIVLCLSLIPFPAFAVNEDYIPIHIDGYYDDWADKAPTEVYPGKNPPPGKINYVKLFRDESKVYVYVQFAYKNNQDITNMIVNLYTNMGNESYFLVPDHWFDTTDMTEQDMAPEAESSTDSLQQDLLTEESDGSAPADQSLTPEQGGGTESTEPAAPAETVEPTAPAEQSETESVKQNTNTQEQNTNTSEANTDASEQDTDISDQGNSPNRGGARTEEPKVYSNLIQETYMLVADNTDNQGNNNSAADTTVTTDTTEKTNNGQGNGPDTTDKTNNGQGNGPVDLTNPVTSLGDVLDLLDPMNPETLTDPEDMLDEIISDTPADSGAETIPPDSGTETGTTPATDSGIETGTGTDSGAPATTDSGIDSTTDSGIGAATDSGIGSDINSGLDSAVDQVPQNGNLDLKKPGYYGTWSFMVWSGMHQVGSGFYTRTEGAPDELELYIPLSSISRNDYDGITEITMRIKKLGPQMVMCAGASTEPYIGVMIGAGIAVLSAGAYSYKKKRPLPFNKG